MNDTVRALLLSVACFEYQYDRPPSLAEIVEMRGSEYGLLRRMEDRGLVRAVCGPGRKWGWSALVAQGVRTY